MNIKRATNATPQKGHPCLNVSLKGHARSRLREWFVFPQVISSSADSPKVGASMTSTTFLRKRVGSFSVV